jgi:hypothetical protein
LIRSTRKVTPDWDVMALQSAYKQFLASPNSSFLDLDASLHYVTTTTSFAGSTEIIKHLSSQRNQIKKKKEEFLSLVEGANAIAAEVDTSLEFMSSGGAYLPSLDDNFLADHTVYLPVVSPAEQSRFLCLRAPVLAHVLI